MSPVAPYVSLAHHSFSLTLKIHTLGFKEKRYHGDSVEHLLVKNPGRDCVFFVLEPLMTSTVMTQGAIPVCWLGQGTFPKLISYQKVHMPFWQKTQEKQGMFLPPSLIPSFGVNCQLQFGLISRLPCEHWVFWVWVVPTVGRKREGRTHTIIVNNSLAVTWESCQGWLRSSIFIWAIACIDVKATVNKSRKPQQPQSKGSWLGCKPALWLCHHMKLVLLKVTTIVKAVCEDLSSGRDYSSAFLF